MRATNLIVATACVAATSSCLQPRLPPIAAPRTPVPVNASYSRTWDAVVAVFAERNITVVQDSAARTVRTPSAIQLQQGDTGGEDCPNQTDDQVLRPQYVTYRVGVSGDATKSTVVAYALYERMPGGGSECGTRGTWETQFEGDVKRRAEQP